MVVTDMIPGSELEPEDRNEEAGVGMVVGVNEDMHLDKIPEDAEDNDDANKDLWGKAGVGTTMASCKVNCKDSSLDMVAHVEVAVAAAAADADVVDGVAVVAAAVERASEHQDMDKQAVGRHGGPLDYFAR